jgi:hypothetical protein
VSERAKPAKAGSKATKATSKATAKATKATSKTAATAAAKATPAKAAASTKTRPKNAKATARPSDAAKDPVFLTLLARPQPAPEVVAAITAAAQLVWPRPVQSEPVVPTHDAWRFSGRWWAQPTPMRRARPWTRP